MWYILKITIQSAELKSIYVLCPIMLRYIRIVVPEAVIKGKGK